MAKAVITIGYSQFVVELEQAKMVAEALIGAERYDGKYHPRTDDTEPYTSYHIWEDTRDDSYNITVISDDRYRKAKLLGKPDNS